MLTAAMLLPMTIAFGAAFPLAWRLPADATNDVTDLGLIYAVNTLGAILGSLLAGFVLIPRIGLHTRSVSSRRSPPLRRWPSL